MAPTITQRKYEKRTKKLVTALNLAYEKGRNPHSQKEETQRTDVRAFESALDFYFSLPQRQRSLLRSHTQENGELTFPEMIKTIFNQML